MLEPCTRAWRDMIFLQLFKTPQGSTDSSGTVPHGLGRMRFADGSVYEGRWRLGMRHGRGTQEPGADGFTYKGDWWGDKAHG